MSRARPQRFTAHLITLLGWLVAALALVGAPSAALAAHAPKAHQALTLSVEVEGPTASSFLDSLDQELLAEEIEVEEEDPRATPEGDNSVALCRAVTLWEAPARASMDTPWFWVPARSRVSRPRLPGGARAPPLG